MSLPRLAVLSLALSASLAAQHAPAPDGSRHVGPPVAEALDLAQGHAGRLWAAWDQERCWSVAAFLDQHYRAAASEGYEASADHVVERLRAAGFGRLEGLELQEWSVPTDEPGWTPRSARLELLERNGSARVLHSFDRPSALERTMLPVFAPACDVSGPVALRLEVVEPGSILVTEARIRSDLLRRAQERGAVAVVSSSLASYNFDSSGAERHLHAIQFRAMEHPCPLPVAQISPHAYAQIREAVRAGAARLRLAADVEFAERPLRVVAATVVGRGSPEEAVPIASHLRGPGAIDNASGVASLVEGAVVSAELLARGEMPWPRRSLVFLFGDEYEQSRAWFERSGRSAVAGLSAIMTGDSPARTGSPLLLERQPDPGALVVLPPDRHTAWGAGEVEEGSLVPSGLDVVARCAVLDVHALSGGTWNTAEHPWEGGTDHDVFLLEHQRPAMLFWHFSGLVYHTSLDRLDFIDAAEMRRTGVAVLATALELCAPRSEALERYLTSSYLVESMRVQVAARHGELENAAAWRAWGEGARTWLRALYAPQ